MSLARWDLSKPATTDNLVLFSSHALKKYDEVGKESIPDIVRRRIENRLAAVRDYNNSMF